MAAYDDDWGDPYQRQRRVARRIGEMRKAQRAYFDTQCDKLRAEMRRDLAAAREERDGDIAKLLGEIRRLRSEVLQALCERGTARDKAVADQISRVIDIEAALSAERDRDGWLQ